MGREKQINLNLTICLVNVFWEAVDLNSGFILLEVLILNKCQTFFNL